MKKYKNPLRKRYIRELIGEWRKYIVIALFLIITIGFISGMFVANNSMLTSADKKKTEYKLEDGCFEVSKELKDDTINALENGEKADVKQYYLDKAHKKIDKEVVKAVDKAVKENIEKSLEPMKQMGMTDEMYDEAFDKAYDEFVNSSDYDKAIEDGKKEAYKEADKKVNEKYEKAADKYDLENPDYKAVPVKIYKNYYKDIAEKSKKHKGKIRVFKDRTDVDLYSIHEGKMPENANEIAIDRMHADNVNVKVGDTINVGGEDYKVTALIALVNYSTLYEKPTDSMFDALYFDVAIVNDEGFDRIDSSIHYNYAWIYDKKPADEVKEKALSENVLASLISQSVVNNMEIEGFLPNYSNEAIHFATNDLGSDKAMSGILLYILIAVLAFIFAITISNTITKEASVVGTLRASGYTRRELTIHYMTMPVWVTLISAIIGNILGYTVFKDVAISMYYNSYSLPTYETYWTTEAFVKTTVIPVILMFVVNLVVIKRMLKLSPLRFLRHDLKTGKRKKAIRLPKWRFITRFRVRILFQNMPNYIVLLFGVLFVMIMLAMAVGFPDSLKAYQANVTDMMFAKYQVVLKTTEDDDENTITTSVKSAEKFAMSSLDYITDKYKETISVYGVVDNSKYIKNLPEMKYNEVCISSTFANKYNLAAGDTFTLEEKYDNGKYKLLVKDIYDYSGSLTVFMPIDTYRELTDKDEDYFTGYMSNEPIEDIDDDYIATTITEDDILKISRQLDHSMGSYMVYFQYICIILSAVLIYLLTKIIIEKNENAISMVKILGYENREISSLYMASTTFVMILFCLVGMVGGFYLMEIGFKAYLMQMEGWFDFVITPIGFVKMFAFVYVAYLIVMVIDYRRIKRIPMSDALKNVE